MVRVIKSDFDIIYEVANIVCNKEVGDTQYARPGVLEGVMGLGLFNFHYSRITGDYSFSTRAYDLLEAIIDHWNSSVQHNRDFGSGLGGLGWVIEYLGRYNFINREDELLETLDGVLEQELRTQLTARNFDQITGANGLMIYFSLRGNNPRVRTVFSGFIDALRSSAVYENGMIKWYTAVKSYVNGMTEITNNLGVPHGMTGRLLTLLKIRENVGLDTITLLKLDELAREIVHSLLAERVPASNGFYFPSVTFLGGANRKRGSKLSWCYGDLSTGYALLKTAIALNDSQLREWSIFLLRDICRRTDCRDNKGLGLCHGITSVAHMFYKLSKITNEVCFKETCFFWQRKAMALLQEKFHAHLKDSEGTGFFHNNSLLTGYPGALLSLSSIERDQLTPWDAALLL